KLNRLAASIAALIMATGTSETSVAGASTQFCRPGLVLAIALQNDRKVLIAGSFSLVNGVARNNIARLNPDGSLDLSWKPEANDAVRQMIINGNDLFVLGEFTRIGGQSRPGLAKLSLTGAGSADPNWNPPHQDNIHALAISGTNLFVGGLAYLARFSTEGIGDGSTWGPQPDYNILVLAVHGTNLYAGGNFSQLGGINRPALGKITEAGNLDLAWDPAVRGPFGSPVSALEISGTELVAGGSFNMAGGFSRTNLAMVAFDGAGDVDSQWNPNPVGPITGASATEGVEAGHVYSVAADGTNLFVCGIFYTAGGLSRTNVAKVR